MSAENLGNKIKIRIRQNPDFNVCGPTWIGGLALMKYHRMASF